MEQQLRKEQDGVRLSANGMLLFGLWNLIKALLYAAFAPEYLCRVLDVDPADTGLVAVVIVVMVSISCLTLLLRFLIYRRAIRRNRGWWYLIAAAAIGLLDLRTMLLLLCGYTYGQDLLDIVSDILLDGAIAVNCFMLIRHSLLARKLIKKCGEGAGDAA